MHSVGIRTIKTALAALLALLSAEALGLEFAAAAAVVAILSVFDTRRATVKGAFERLISAVLALAIGTAAFEILGYTPFAFGAFLLFFVPISFLLKVSIGLGPSSVLVTHLLAKGAVTGGLLANEMALMFLGTGFAILTNIYAFSEKKKIQDLFASINEDIKEVLNIFARSLTENYEIHTHFPLFVELNKKIQEVEKLAILEEDNMFGSGGTRDVYKARLLKQESQILETMFRDLDSIPPEYVSGGKMAEILRTTSTQLTQDGAVYEIEKRLRLLEDDNMTRPLPKTAEEFRQRALLFQVFRSFQDFVRTKSSFENAARIFQ